MSCLHCPPGAYNYARTTTHTSRAIPFTHCAGNRPPRSLSDVPSLPALRALSPELLQPYMTNEPCTTSLLPEYLLLQLSVAAIAAYFFAAAPTRPRGWSRKDLIEVRNSPVAGKGIFAKVDIPADVILGAYPGRVRSPAEMIEKCVAAPEAQFYCFKNSQNQLLDPTDWTGRPSTAPLPGVPWLLPTDVTLSYANEPPKNSPGVNVTVEDDPKDSQGLLFVTVVPISAGSEIYVDYGLNYDRSGYGKAP